MDEINDILNHPAFANMFNQQTQGGNTTGSQPMISQPAAQPQQQIPAPQEQAPVGDLPSMLKLGSPILTKFLLSMGAGMQNQPTFGRAMGSGVQAGNQSLIDSISDQQKEAELEQRAQKQQLAELARQKSVMQMQYDHGRTIAQKILNGVDQSTLKDKDKTMLTAASQTGDPSAVWHTINAILGPKSKADRNYGPIQAMKVDGRTAFYQTNPDDPNDVHPVGSPSIDPALGSDMQTIYGADGGQDKVVFDSRGMPHKVATIKAPENMPEALQKDMGDLAALQSQTNRLVSNYKPEYSGVNLMDRAKQKLDGSLDYSEIVRNDPKSIGQVEFWKDYQNWVNAVRNKQFGASLTPGEKTEFEKAIIGRGTDPKQIEAFLKRQQDIVGLAAERKNRMVQGGYYQQGQKGAAREQLDPRAKQTGNIFNMD